MSSIACIVQAIWSKLNQSRSNRRFRPDVSPVLAVERLEERSVLTVNLSALSPVAGVANSSGGWECFDPTISGVIEGVEYDHTVRLDFDFDGDGFADDSRSLSAGASGFEYDPRLLDPDLLGAINLLVKATEFDSDGTTVLDSTGWESVLLNVSDPTPVISDLSFDHDSGDNYVLTGHVSGPYLSGVKVWVSGAFSNSALIDGNGNFSITHSLPLGATGMLEVSVTDTHENTGSDYIFVDVADPTPSVWVNYSNGSGDEYVFSGAVSGTYAAGATVNLVGVVNATVVADANGYFSVTKSFPTGVTGSLIVNVTDIHDHSNSSSLLVDIPDPTQS